MSSNRLVDVIIATHDLSRPVERAAFSVLKGAPTGTHVIIICHGVPPIAVRERLPAALMDRIKISSHLDGVASPAGPMNAGLALSRASFVSFMGSDDYLRPGALEAWIRLAKSADAPDVVIARLEHQDGGLIRTPPRRWGRRWRRLDFVRDRLFYRSAPLGLIRRSVLTDHALQFESGLVTGEDLLLGLKLWTQSRVVYAGRAPAYVVGADADERASKSIWSVSTELECCIRLLASPWFSLLNDAQREAVVVKLIRVNILGAIAKRSVLPQWEAQDRRALAASTAAVLAACPRARDDLSLAEGRLLSAALDENVPDSTLRALSERRLRHGRWDTIWARNPEGMLGRHSALRLMVASTLMS